MPQAPAAGVPVVVPATVWAPPAHATGPGWSEWVRDRVRRSFLPSGGSWRDMTAVLTDPAAQGLCPVPPPFWAALVDAPTARTAPVADPTVAVTAPPETGLLRRGTVLASSADTADPAPTDVSPRSDDVVFADLTDIAEAVDGRLGMIAASLMGGGGILAVLTRCHHHADGALADVTSEIVASAQNADLLYLQHIVIPAEPLRTVRPTATAHPNPDRSRAHGVAHADLLVFSRPRTGNTHPSPGARPDVAAAGKVIRPGPPGTATAVAATEAAR